MTLLLTAVAGSWAADATPTYAQPSATLDLMASDLSTTLSGITWKSRSSNRQDSPFYLTDDYLVLSIHLLAYTNGSLDWVSQDNAQGNSNGASWAASTPFPSYATFFTSTSDNAIKLQPTRMVAVKVKNCSEAYLYAENNAQLNVYTVGDDDGTTAYNSLTKKGSVNTSSSTKVVKVTGLNPAETYIVQAVGTKSGSNANGYAFAFKREAAGPTITTQPVGTSYVTGATISALTVAATASGGTLSYQWYSCDDAAKTNAAAITGATSASYTPTAAGFYYVTVTDSNGSVDSDVVQISISAAEAPTISVSGTPASAVVVGTEVTLTAEVTGNPTPTITWYDGTDAEVGTGETYSPSTATAGTYTFYAVASNGVGTDATSAVQSIVVKEQVATPTFTPNGAYFESSQEVTIACETADATIQYSTDGGTTWNNYTTALTFTATTTVKAKATKDGYIDSEMATATFNKVELADITSISATTTWDWSKYGTKEIGTENTAFYRSDILVSNVSQYGYAAAASTFGPAESIILNGDYIVRDSKFCQVTHAKFNTTVPGTIEVVFSNTGGNRPYRYLYVNGVQTEFKSNVSNANTTAKNIFVPAGDVDIYGVLDPEADDSGAGKENFIRIYSIKFTSAPATIDVAATHESGYRTFSSKYPTDWSNAPEGITAYTAAVNGDNVTFTPFTGQAPAGTGLLVKCAAANTNYAINVLAANPNAITNALVGAPNGTTVGAGAFVLYDGEKGVGFYKTTAESFTIGERTAYLPASVSSARTFIALDEETTGIGASLMNSERVNSEVYNLNGQRVMNPAKGLYIVNGKKVVIK